MSVQDWGCDVPVSMPEPLGGQVRAVPMFGFVFTINGLFHDLTDVEHERLSVPTFAPISPAATVWDDADVEDR